MADFKPIKIGDTDMETGQQDLVKFVNEDWLGNPVVKNWHPHWEEWIKWFEGDQYMLVNKETGKLEDVTSFVERDIKNVYNRLTPIIRQQWGELRYDHRFYTEPNTTEKSDIEAARKGSSFIEWTNYIRDFKRKINMAKLIALITGNIFWKEFWNPNLVGYIQKGDGYTEVDGDIDYDWVNPFNCRPDPMGINRDAWRWFTEGKRLPTSVIADEFEVEKKDIPAEPRKGTFDSGLFERENFEQSTEPTAIRKEHYRRPCKQYPKGKMLVTVGQWLMHESDNPNPKKQIGYFHFKGIMPIFDQLWGDSSVRLGQDSQRQLNRLSSMVDEHVENYRPKALIPFGSLRDGELRTFKRGGVDYVIYNPRIGQPFWQDPPKVGQEILNWISHQENEIETQMSVRKVSLGQLPKYATRASGVLFEGLKQQDEIVLLPTIEDWDGVLEDVMRYRLELIQDKYTHKRMVKILGKRGESSVKFFKGAELNGNTDVRVKSGVDIFTTRNLKKEVVGMMIEKGMITDPKQAFELLGLEKTVEEYYEDEYVDQLQAKRHLEIMKEKDLTIIFSPNDNPEIHFDVFNSFRKTPEFETLNKEAQTRILKRIEEAKARMGGEGGGGEVGGEDRVLAEKEAELGITPGGGGATATPLPVPAGGGVPPIPPEILEMLATLKQGGI